MEADLTSGTKQPLDLLNVPEDAEEVLLKKEALQSAIFNSASFSSIVTDAKGIIQIFNVAAERMLGYTAAEVMNKIMLAELHDPQDGIARAEALSVEFGTPIAPGFDALVFKAARGIEDVYELTNVRKDGSRFPAMVSVTELRDAEAAIIGYLFLGTDNTSRKQTKEALVKAALAAAELAAIQSAVSEAAIIAVTDLTGRIEQVNDNFVTISKYSREELIGQDHRLLNSGLHSKEFIRDLWLTIAKGEVWRKDIRNRAKDGSLYWVDTVIAPVLNEHGKPVKFIAVRFDITDRKKAEQELSEKARLLDLSNDAIIVHDLDDKVTSWNKGAEKLYGWKSEEMMGKELHSVLQTEFPKSREAGYAQLRNEGHFSGEVVQIARDGWRVVALCRKVLDRGTESILTSYTDITERRMLEDSLAARASDLVRADRSKDEFLAMLAHELRNPLAPLRNAAEILQTPGASADEHSQAQRIIGRQIGNMTRMIDDLLDVSRITEGRIELCRQPTALADILAAAASVARSGSAARRQELTISLPAEPIFLNADATRLDQVFGNLLGNACKYSDSGCHISLSAERAAGVEPPEVIVRVRDDGTGIAPELLPHIFDLFVQSTRSLDRAHGGLGIGLTLVQRLVKLHGGSVEARSEGSGQGSEFIVRLPTVEGSLPLAAETAAAAKPVPARRVLVVDDNVDAASSLATLLQLNGHQVRMAHDGATALEMAMTEPPEVAILDIGLPVLNGFDVARRLRQQRGGAATPLLVALTGWGQPEDRRRSYEAGFDAHLVKPVAPSALDDLLRSLSGGPP